MNIFLLSPYGRFASEFGRRKCKRNRSDVFGEQICLLIRKRLAIFSSETQGTIKLTADSLLAQFSRKLPIRDYIETSTILYRHYDNRDTPEGIQLRFYDLIRFLLDNIYSQQTDDARGYSDLLLVIDPQLIILLARLVNPKLKHFGFGRCLRIEVDMSQADLGMPIIISIFGKADTHRVTVPLRLEYWFLKLLGYPNWSTYGPSILF